MSKPYDPRFVPTEHVGEPDPSAHRRLTRPMQDHCTRLFGWLYWHEAHGRTRYYLADRFCNGHVSLSLVDLGLHVSRRRQLDVVLLRRKLSRPIVPYGARGGPDPAEYSLRNGRFHLGSPRSTPNSQPAISADAVHLEQQRGDVRTFNRDPFDGSPPNSPIRANVPTAAERHQQHHEQKMSRNGKCATGSTPNIKIARALCPAPSVIPVA